MYLKTIVRTYGGWRAERAGGRSPSSIYILYRLYIYLSILYRRFQKVSVADTPHPVPAPSHIPSVTTPLKITEKCAFYTF